MRLIDADELLKHEVEADRMGAMLVVGKGYILSAPTIDAVRVVHGCIELLVDDSEVTRVRERILYFLTDELRYEEDIDFIF